MNVADKIRKLGIAGKYDVCASCGDARSLPNPNAPLLDVAAESAIYHSYTPDGRSVSLFKTLMTNQCSFDCGYCANSCTKRKAAFTPEELATVFMYLYRKNRVQGLFLSSGVAGDVDRVAERMLSAARLIRVKNRFPGYIHFKILPGMSYEHVKQAVELADRVSINLEAASSGRLSELAPGKDFRNDIIKRQSWLRDFAERGELAGGHTTQFIVGGTDQSDWELLQALDWEYKHMKLNRGYFSAFTPEPGTPFQARPPEPKAREVGMYRTDFLFRKYKVKLSEVKEILTDSGNLPRMDPKVALARLTFDGPLDVNEAPYEELLRIPGIGPTSAYRLMRVRQRGGRITSRKELAGLGASVRRAAPFIKLNGWTQARVDGW